MIRRRDFLKLPHVSVNEQFDMCIAPQLKLWIEPLREVVCIFDVLWGSLDMPSSVVPERLRLCRLLPLFEPMHSVAYADSLRCHCDRISFFSVIGEEEVMV
jgi:hypothetical protein